MTRMTPVLVPIPWQPHLLTHPDMLAKLTLANTYRGRPILMGSTRAPNGRYLAAWRSYADGVYLWNGYRNHLPGFSSASNPDSGPRSHQRGVGDDLLEWGSATLSALERAGIQVNGVAGEPWHIQPANFASYPIITSYTAPSGGNSTPITPAPDKDGFDMATLDELRTIVKQVVNADSTTTRDAVRRESRQWRLFRNTSKADDAPDVFVAINYGLDIDDPRQVIYLNKRQAESLSANYLMLADSPDNAQKLDATGIATALRMAKGTDTVYSTRPTL